MPKNGDICHYIDMKRIKDEKKISRLLNEHHIRELFSSSDLPFELYAFEKGEFLNNELDPLHYITFVISGTIRILNIRDDGSLYQIASGSGFSCLGDMEFGSGQISPYLVEALRKTLCLVLPLAECRRQLENDPVFLRFLLKNVTAKLSGMTAAAAGPKTLREKTLYYMANECEDHTLSGVEKASCALACSKRQLLRILRSLCDENRIVRLGRGRYRLI